MASSIFFINLFPKDPGTAIQRARDFVESLKKEVSPEEARTMFAATMIKNVGGLYEEFEDYKKARIAYCLALALDEVEESSLKMVILEYLIDVSMLLGDFDDVRTSLIPRFNSEIYRLSYHVAPDKPLSAVLAGARTQIMQALSFLQTPGKGGIVGSGSLSDIPLTEILEATYSEGGGVRKKMEELALIDLDIGPTKAALKSLAIAKENLERINLVSQDCSGLNMGKIYDAIDGWGLRCDTISSLGNNVDNFLAMFSREDYRADSPAPHFDFISSSMNLSAMSEGILSYIESLFALFPEWRELTTVNVKTHPVFAQLGSRKRTGQALLIKKLEPLRIECAKAHLQFVYDSLKEGGIAYISYGMVGRCEETDSEGIPHQTFYLGPCYPDLATFICSLGLQWTLLHEKREWVSDSQSRRRIDALILRKNAV